MIKESSFNSIFEARARPLLDDTSKWIEKVLRPLSAKKETVGAIRYPLSHWRALTRYTIDRLGLARFSNLLHYRRDLRGFALRTVSRGPVHPAHHTLNEQMCLVKVVG